MPDMAGQLHDAVESTGQGQVVRGWRGAAGIVCLMQSPHVVELEVQEPFKLWLRFDDGIASIVDLSDSAALGGVFAAWTDQDFWRSAHIVADSGAVAWGDGTEVDVCPLSLYLDVTGQTFDERG